MKKVIKEQITYKNYRGCIRLDSGPADVVVTVSEGPRIIRYGFSGQRNELCDDAPMTMPVMDEEWRLMGGHRLLHSPEEFPRTYEPDNDPVAWEEIPNGIKVVCAQKKISRIKKEMDITMTPGDTGVQIVHRLVNENAWPIKTAPWACTVMAMGGTVVIPFCQQSGHFKDGAADARYTTFWSYTDTGDARIGWGERYVTIGCDPGTEKNLKVGFSNRAGWGGYVNDGHLFIVEADYIENAAYPDNGCSFEVFTCDFMSEIETLAPFSTLKPGGEAVHVERWRLCDNVDLGSFNDQDIDAMVGKYV